MKTKIIGFTLAMLILSAALFGCVSENESTDTTAPETQDETQTDAPDTTDAPAEVKLFEYSEVEGGYSYKLYNKDGTLAEEMDFCERLPMHGLVFEKISKITVGGETYYYDHETRKFSETFTEVFDENGSLLIRSEGERIIVCAIFDRDGFYKEFSDFTYGLSKDSPFVSCSFIDGGGSIKVVYLNDEGENRLECFNITNGTRCVIIEDWKNNKSLISGDVRDSVKSFLYGYMGTRDYNTGLELTYTISGSLRINGEIYYHCECFYVMTEDGEENLVSAAEFVLSEDYAKRYDCRDKDGELIVYTENNMI